MAEPFAQWTSGKGGASMVTPKAISARGPSLIRCIAVLPSCLLGEVWSRFLYRGYDLDGGIIGNRMWLIDCGIRLRAGRSHRREDKKRCGASTSLAE